jgi:hypothetical protein
MIYFVNSCSLAIVKSKLVNKEAAVRVMFKITANCRGLMPAADLRDDINLMSAR